LIRPIFGFVRISDGRIESKGLGSVDAVSSRRAILGLFLVACTDRPTFSNKDGGPVLDSSLPRDAAIEDAGVNADADPVDADPIDADPIDADPIDADPMDADPVDADPSDATADAGIPFNYWANLQWPPYATLAPAESVIVYGQIWIEGTTDQPGAAAGIEAELGFGPVGSDPSSWTWTPATYNVDVGNNDEYLAELIAPSSGLFDYLFRYRLNGSPWIFGERAQGGPGKLAVRTVGSVLRIATLNLHCLNDDPSARYGAAVARFTALGTELIALQEVCEGAPVANAAEYLAQALTVSTGRAWRHAFAQTHLANNVTPEGVGIVTSLPLADVQIHDLPVADFPRRTIVAVAASPVGIVAFATAHLSFRVQDDQARLDQAREIVARIDQLPIAPAVAIVAGDFNSTPDEPPSAAMIDASFLDVFDSVHPTDDGFTYSAASPVRRIDYLFARPDAARPLQITSADVEFTQPYAPSSYVSDHRGVSATLTAQ
jgi:endonuclease/exonuclease/phosphatase family metal-dependent hydrolase